jgi:hypothetical protein
MIIHHLKPSWTQALTIGALLNDISRIELFKIIIAFIIGIFTTILYTEIVARYTPSVYFDRPRDRVAIQINGIHATVHIMQIMPRDSCEGTVVVRRLYTLWPDNIRPKGLSKDEPMDVAWFREHDVPWSHRGTHDLYIHLNLYGPVDPTKHWFFEYERYDNCTLLDLIFPNKPISNEAIPTTFTPEDNENKTADQ